jgi:hypothetical protein
MGFHVNVSAVDKDGGTIPLSRGMLTEIMYEWLPYERKNYTKLRGEGSIYAEKIKDFINDKNLIQNLKNIIEDREHSTIDIEDLYAKYGLSSYLTIKKFSKEKGLSLTNYKNNNVLEFRVFPSSNDIEKLLEYTSDAISVFTNGIENYLEHPSKTILELQKTYYKYRFVYDDSAPLESYTGTLASLEFLGTFRPENRFHVQFIYKVKKGLFGDKIIVDKEDKIKGFDKLVIYYYGNLYETYEYDIIPGKESGTFTIKNPVEIDSKRYRQIGDAYRS